MKIVLMIALALVQLGLGPKVVSAGQPKLERKQVRIAAARAGRVWRPATYRGLTMGKSTKDDMLRVFGEPRSSGRPPGQSEYEDDPSVRYEYDNSGEFSGILGVTANKRTGVIESIDVEPKGLSTKAAVEHFGQDFRITRYDRDRCLSDSDESAPWYESPSGSTRYFEYRARGIALNMGANGIVKEIDYRDGPIGSRTSGCDHGSIAERGTYSNYDYAYSVAIPRDQVGCGSPTPFPNHGFGIDLAKPSCEWAESVETYPSSSIYVEAFYNSLEWTNTDEELNFQLDFLKEKKATNIRVDSRARIQMQGRPARHFLIRYEQAGQEFVDEIFFVIRDEDINYALELTTPASRYARDRKTFAEVRRTFRFRPLPNP